MKSLYDKAAFDEIIKRIELVQSGMQRQWGKMDPAQMFAHCTAAVKVPAGKAFPPRLMIGRILGPLFKSRFLGKGEFTRNSPTDPSFIVADPRDFKMEKEGLLRLLRELSDAGEAGCSKHPHSFFGKLTPREWGVAMHKHLDHHLRQFGA
jgi:hypothetical protein